MTTTNVLVATSYVKLYTGIITTDYDYLIENLVPTVLEDIVEYCNNNFVNSTQYWRTDKISFSSNSTITISDTSMPLDYYWKSGDKILVLGSIFNDGYYSISTVASSSLSINESISSESSSTGKIFSLHKVDYPKDLPVIASRMIKHTITTLDDSNIASESLGDYSVSYVEVGANSYPQSIIKGLDKYRKIRCL